MIGSLINPASVVAALRASQFGKQNPIYPLNPWENPRKVPRRVIDARLEWDKHADPTRVVRPDNPARKRKVEPTPQPVIPEDPFNPDNLSDSDWLNHIYKSQLGRDIGEEGKTYWGGELEGGQSRDEVLANIRRSDEYKNKQGSQSDEDWVRDTYRTELGREARKEGLDYWIKDLSSGQTRDEVIANIRRSDEYKSRDWNDITDDPFRPKITISPEVPKEPIYVPFEKEPDPIVSRRIREEPETPRTPRPIDTWNPYPQPQRRLGIDLTPAEKMGSIPYVSSSQYQQGRQRRFAGLLASVLGLN